MYIAIDGGGTKTDCIAFTEKGQVTRRAVRGPSNINNVGLQAASQAVIDAICAVTDAPEAVFAGIAGCGGGDNAKMMRETLQKRFPGIPIEIESDLACVFGAFRGKDNCIVAISGTGSAVSLRQNGELRRFGGWGSLFDGGGNGYGIGRDALRCCLAARDGLDTLPCEKLLDLVEKDLSCRAWQAITRLYTMGKEDIASFAACVFEAAKDGDEAALQIIRDNARVLAEWIAKASEIGNTKTVLLSGGLLTGSELYRCALQSILGEGFVYHIMTRPAVYGSALRCAEMAGIQCAPNEFDANFDNTIGVCAQC